MTQNLRLEPIDLGDHLLWPDGTIQVVPERLIDFSFKLNGNGLDRLSVTELTPEIEQFNDLSEHKISIKSEIDTNIFPPAWIVPQKYQELDLDAFLFGLAEKIENDSLYDVRLQRLTDEIVAFKEFDLDSVLRLLVYIIDKMQESNIVWGVGRGSSCSSYLLYLMGLHEIDPVLFDIPLSDFLK